MEKDTKEGIMSKYRTRKWYPVAVLVVACMISLFSDAMLVGFSIGATLLVDAGKAIVTNRIKGSGTEPVYVAWGTGAGTTAAGNTTLFTEASEARVSGTSTRVTTSVTNDTYQVVGTITADAGKTITNAGLFDASTSGNLFVKGDFTGIALNTGDSIQFTIKVQFS